MEVIFWSGTVPISLNFAQNGGMYMENNFRSKKNIAKDWI